MQRAYDRFGACEETVMKSGMLGLEVPVRPVVAGLVFVSLCVPLTASAEGIKADVEVYGTLVPHVEYMDTDGGTPSTRRPAASQVPAAAYTGFDEPARLRMTQGTSHLGFRGTFDLAEDLK